MHSNDAKWLIEACTMISNARICVAKFRHYTDDGIYLNNTHLAKAVEGLRQAHDEIELFAKGLSNEKTQ